MFVDEVDEVDRWADCGSSWKRVRRGPSGGGKWADGRVLSKSQCQGIRVDYRELARREAPAKVVVSCSAG
jgi:hypothetical protein